MSTKQDAIGQDERRPGVLTTRPSRINLQTSSKPTFTKPTFVPDPRIVFGTESQSLIIRSIVQDAQEEQRAAKSPQRKLRRSNNNTRGLRNLAKAHQINPPRSQYNTTPLNPSNLSNVMIAHYSEPELEAEITPLSISVNKPSLLNKELPPKPILRDEFSPEKSHSLVDATDSTSNSLNFPVLKPKVQSSIESFSVPSSLNSNTIPDAVSEFELGIAEFLKFNNTPSSSTTTSSGHDEMTKKEVPKVAQTKTSLLRMQKNKRESISGEDTNEGSPYALNLPPGSRRVVSASSHISTQKNGSPAPKKTRSAGSNGFGIDGNLSLSEQKPPSLRSRFSQVEPSTFEMVAGSNEGEHQEGETPADSAVGRNSVQSQEEYTSVQTRFGPQLRIARNAYEVIMGEPESSNAANPVTNADTVVKDSKGKSQAKKPRRGKSLPSSQVSHPPRTSSLPGSPENQLLASGPQSAVDRLSQPTASSKAKSTSKFGNVVDGFKNKVRGKSLSSANALDNRSMAKPNRRVSANLPKSNTKTSIMGRMGRAMKGGKRPEASGASVAPLANQGGDGAVTEEFAGIYSSISRNDTIGSRAADGEQSNSGNAQAGEDEPAERQDDSGVAVAAGDDPDDQPPLQPVGGHQTPQAIQPAQPVQPVQAGQPAQQAQQAQGPVAHPAIPPTLASLATVNIVYNNVNTAPRNLWAMARSVSTAVIMDEEYRYVVNAAIRARRANMAELLRIGRQLAADVYGGPYQLYENYNFDQVKEAHRQAHRIMGIIPNQVGLPAQAVPGGQQQTPAVPQQAAVVPQQAAVVQQPATVFPQQAAVIQPVLVAHQQAEDTAQNTAQNTAQDTVQDTAQDTAQDTTAQDGQQAQQGSATQSQPQNQ